MKQFTWKQCAPLVLVVMGIGLVLNLWHPLYLAPPSLEATWIIYAVLGLAWLPVLIICLLRKPAGNPRTPFLLTVLGILVMGLGLCSAPALPISFWGTPPHCQVVANTDQRIRYECVVNRMFLIDKYVFEGLPGLPVVWLVSRQTVNL